jgi:cellulose synthase/poly-beta-1,6-N-acetylglucosamine synthase-like glycosyltransferase/peptidoglycan/xylan/chitin deacetylase (PgdA/CDA1 family)
MARHSHATRRRDRPRARARRPIPSSTSRLHWTALVVLLIGFVCVLLVNGAVRGALWADHEVAPPGEAVTVPERIQTGGPIIDARAQVARSYQIPGRTIVLTFDDGPDPVWTPQILAVLLKHSVPATFFVAGNRAALHPHLVSEIHRSGSELGVHTFSHPDLALAPDWRRQAELSATELTLAGAAGVTTSLLRPPYSSSSDAIDDSAWLSVRFAGERGYLVVLTSLDTRDWARPGVDKIVAAAIPDQGKGGVVLMHDYGGDRSQTVAALDVLIPKLKDLGYRFSTVAEAMGQPTFNPPTTPAEGLRGQLALLIVKTATVSVHVLVVLFAVVGVLVITRLLLLIPLARRHVRRRPPLGRVVTEPASVVVPAYNEGECIADTVRSLVRSDHPVEVVVVDDGSTDDTAAQVERLRLPSVRLVRQPNGGKPAALNTGITYARHDLIVMMDGDTVFEPTTVGRLVQPFRDPGVGAVSGNTKVLNRSGLLGQWQHIEYVVGFNLDRRAYDILQCMPTVPGAVGAFRWAALVDVGGVSDDTLAEDTDLTMAISRAGWRVVYEPGAVAWTEVPATLGQLWRQRYRWCYGTIQSIWKHRRAVRESGSSGRFGRVGLVHLGLYQVILPLLAPLMDVFLVYGLLFLNPLWTVLAWLALLATQTAGGLYAFRLDREPMRSFWLFPLQQLVYRQLMYTVVIQSVATALEGVRLRWHKLQRAGGLSETLAGRSAARSGAVDS